MLSDPKIYGAVNNFEFHIKDIVINNGAEMIVALRFKNTVTQPGTVSEIEQTLLMAQDFENLNKPA